MQFLVLVVMKDEIGQLDWDRIADRLLAYRLVPYHDGLKHPLFLVQPAIPELVAVEAFSRFHVLCLSPASDTSVAHIFCPAAAGVRRGGCYKKSSGSPTPAVVLKVCAMIPNSVDVSSRVSPRLTALLLSRINNPESEQPVTLIAVRRFLADLLPTAFREAEQMHHFDISGSLLDELDALIDEFGQSALAVDFAQASASEALSRVIEAMLDDENYDNPPTLGKVREALLAGLGARLVGEGAFDDDEDDTLLGEVDALIEQFGAHTPAEECLHF